MYRNVHVAVKNPVMVELKFSGTSYLDIVTVLPKCISIGTGIIESVRNFDFLTVLYISGSWNRYIAQVNGMH